MRNYVPVVRSAIELKLTDRPDYGGSSHLWITDVGNCPRKAMLRLAGVPLKEFPLKVLEAMHEGDVAEADTLDSLVYAYSAGRVERNRSLRNDIWSGKTDAILRLENRDPIVMEHKATGDKWWNYKEWIPRNTHICQLVMYGMLYREKFDVDPRLVLYYRSWGHWADMVILDHGDWVEVDGWMDGEPYQKRVDLNVRNLRLELEQYFISKDMPPRLEVEEMDGQCTFRGEPACGYYENCWSVNYAGNA